MTFKEEDEVPLHVFDLPQLYQKPSFQALMSALSLLKISQSGFDKGTSRVQGDGVTKYLTNIISSPLGWIASEDEQEEIWNKASKCLAQRAGRTAMGDVTRTFPISTSTGIIDIVLNEPALTEDRLGLKTWSSSYILAAKIHDVDLVPDRLRHSNEPTILELGAGTGLVGIAAAMRGLKVILTDLPEIVSNLAMNIDLNIQRIQEYDGRACSGVLDWKNPEQLLLQTGMRPIESKFAVILIADPVYDAEHPHLLTRTIAQWLQRSSHARVILTHPLRDGYSTHFCQLRKSMNGIGLALLEESFDTGHDDWAAQVRHSCSVWTWRP